MRRILRKEMMSNVCLDDVVEQVFANKTKVTINGARSAFDESPGLVFKMRNIDVVVVKVGDGNCER